MFAPWRAFSGKHIWEQKPLMPQPRPGNAAAGFAEAEKRANIPYIWLVFLGCFCLDFGGGHGL